MLMHTIGLLDSLLSSSTIGITVWVFFIQAPFLLDAFGRAKFIPQMMKITRLYAKVIVVTTLLNCAVAYANDTLFNGGALVALACALINSYGIIPYALKAGARSMSEKNEENASRTAKDFVSTGGSATKV
jgi:hypothetical protein